MSHTARHTFPGQSGGGGLQAVVADQLVQHVHLQQKWTLGTALRQGTTDPRGCESGVQKKACTVCLSTINCPEQETANRRQLPLATATSDSRADAPQSQGMEGCCCRVPQAASIWVREGLQRRRNHTVPPAMEELRFSGITKGGGGGGGGGGGEEEL